MKIKQHFLILFFTLISTFSFAQTGNVKLGTGAGSSITSGDYNVIIGDSTATNLGSSSFTVIIGSRAGFNSQHTSANENIFIGYQAGYTNTTGSDNTFIGFRAGYFNVNQADNTFIGNGAGFNNTYGNDNTFLGEAAGAYVTTGDDNTFIGHKAGAGSYSSITTNSNAISGIEAITGSDNTAVGSTALFSISSNFRNTAVGNGAGFDLDANSYRPAPTTVDSYNYGSYNTFVGDSTGVDVGKGAFNTFIGQAAGAATEAGSRNTFIGFRAGWDNNRTNHGDDAHENTYLGFRTGHTNREGSYNVLLGSRTDFKTRGDTRNNYNVAIGYNTEIGGSGFDGKDYVVIIGANASVNANYAVAIGAGAKATIDSTMVLGGATNRLTVGIGTDTPNIKSSLDLADTDKGFLINRLTNAQKTILQDSLKVTDMGMMLYDTDDKALYVWDGASWNSAINTDNQDVSLDTITNILSLSNDATTIDLTPYLDNTDTQNLTSASLSGNTLTVAIENGASVIVDLSPLLSDLETKNTAQQLQIDDLLTRIATIESCACGGVLGIANIENGDIGSRSNQPILYQNIPNPFNGTTSIKYYLPKKYNEGAIVISNNVGQVMETIMLKEKGEQELFFNSDSLAAGVYYYSLFADAHKFDTKKMIIE